MNPERIPFKIHFILCLAVCLVVFPAAISAAFDATPAHNKKNVLILNSYHQGFKWTDDITRGALSGLSPISEETRTFIEYMNTKWVKDDLYFQELRQILKHKYARTRFDLIICSDNDAFDFLRHYRDEVFGITPVVFCGVNYFKKESLSGVTLFTGVSETADLRESLELALRLHPRVKRIFVINDTGISGRIVRDEIEKLAPVFQSRARIVYENHTDLEKIVKDVAALPLDTLIFYTFFYGDPSNQTYENSDCITLISRHARVPVYGAWDFNLGYGMVGGRLTSGYDQGLAAGSMGLRILRGEKVEDIPPITRSRTRFMFDYRQMERFGISKSTLPPGSVVINGPEPFRRVSLALIWATIFGIACLGGVILMLLQVNRQRRRSEELLQSAHDQLEMTVAERTRDLSQLNEQLRNDIRARQRAEEELQQANRELKSEVEARRKAEEAASHSVSLLRATIESTNDGILVVDTAGGVVDWNGRFLEMWRIPEAVMSSRDEQRAQAYVREQLTDPDGFAAKVSELYGRPEQESLDILRFRDGRIFERYSRPQWMSNEIVGRVWSFRDITERKRMEEEILKAQKLESLGVLAGGIAHDFNNLMTGVMGNISLAIMNVDPDSKAYSRLQDAENACDQTRDLTRQLLTFAKGGAPVRKLDSIARIITESAGFVLRGSNVRCEFILPEELWDMEVDGGQMSQVINNLIINADQAMPDGGVITVRAENIVIGPDTTLPLQEGEYAHILIRDQGTGISEEILPKIFDPYFTTKKKGSGLGLASVYSIIRRHEGHVGVESKPGAGTTFHLYLPASKERCEREADEPARPTPVGGTCRILVVDDERVVRETAREVLEHLGYSVDACDDGSVAVDLYREARESATPYSVVFMDLTIPGGMGGKVLMKKLLDIDPDAKGVVMSGYSNDQILTNYRQYGFCGMVSKPFSLEEILEVLKSLLKEGC
jgi:PAS domain S-box-containing protein